MCKCKCNESLTVSPVTSGSVQGKQEHPSDKYTAVAAACALSASIGAAFGACFLFFVATVFS